MTRYASKTSVSSNTTRDEIEKTLKRYGATSFAYGSSTDTAMVGFVADGRQVRFVLQLPDRTSRDFTHTPATRAVRSTAAADAAYEQAIRQKWRALLLLVKAKLEAVESGIVSFESEFLAHIVLPDNGTVFDHVQPTIAAVYAENRVRPLLQLDRAA
jgi:hypothetical protein